jgi:hypothetical protein
LAFVDGENMGTSSVGRSLSRHKLKHAADATHAPGGENAGEGKEVTITKMPGGGFHTKSTHHDGHSEEADHQNIEQAMEHVHSHMGAQKPMREKNPKMKEREAPPEPVAADHSAGGNTGGLAAMGVDAEG